MDFFDRAENHRLSDVTRPAAWPGATPDTAADDEAAAWLAATPDTTAGADPDAEAA
jgi:hypothetical protein